MMPNFAGVEMSEQMYDKTIELRDAIEALRAENARLRAALEIIAKADYRGNQPFEQRIAREALAGVRS